MPPRHIQALERPNTLTGRSKLGSDRFAGSYRVSGLEHRDAPGAFGTDEGLGEWREANGVERRLTFNAQKEAKQRKQRGVESGIAMA